MAQVVPVEQERRPARAGQLPGFTGIDADYEPPPDPELVLGAGSGTVSEQVSRVLDLLQRTLS